MFEIFKGFSLKFRKWLGFTKSCFLERGFQLKESKDIAELSLKVFDKTNSYNWTDHELAYFHSVYSRIFGIYFGCISYHDAIQTLCLDGHALNSFCLLRPHLESLLLMAFFLEDSNDLEILEQKISKYNDWLCIKMKQNMDKSLKSELAKIVMKEDYVNTINNNFDLTRSDYIDKVDQFQKLSNSNNFLDYKERIRVSKLIEIEDLYYHIYSETSATIHVADMSDRMSSFGENSEGYKFSIKKDDAAVWPITLSNLLQIKCISLISKFLKCEEFAKSKIHDIFN